MAYILENDVLRLECTQKAGEMLHLVKKSTGRETPRNSAHTNNKITIV